MITDNSFSRKAPKILFYGFTFFALAKGADFLFYGFSPNDLVSTISFALLAFGFFRNNRAAGHEDKFTLSLLVVGLALGIGQILTRHLL